MAPKFYRTAAVLFAIVLVFNPIVVLAVAAAAAAGHDANLAVLDPEAFIPDFLAAAGFGPRYFVNGKPATPAMRFATSDLKNDPNDEEYPHHQHEQKRQEAQQCPAGQHSCLEIGNLGADSCCGNDQYCFLNSTWAPKCCALGSPCDSLCPESMIFSNETLSTTTTFSTTLTPTTTGGSPTPLVTETQLVALTTAPACRGRPCSSSSFLCQAPFGGQCCPYNARCVSGGDCLVETTSSAISTLVTPVPPGCTTSQITCTEGGGCCNIGSTCTVAVVSATATTNVCAPNLTALDNGGRAVGLSDGAKAGVGVGVVVAVAAVVALLTWFWLRRRHRATAAASSDAPPVTDDGDLRAPYLPGGRDAASMSEVSGATGAPRPRLHQHGRLYGYFGPEAVSGPYTDREDDETPSQLGSGAQSSPGLSNQTGVPVKPMGPGDIRGPVEIDSRTRGQEPGDVTGVPGEQRSSGGERGTFVEEQQGPFELEGGSFGYPSPPSPDDPGRGRAQGPSPPPP